MKYDIRTMPTDKILVSPSLLAADFCKLGEQVTEVAAAGAEALHLDVMDGRMVPNISFGVPVIESLRKVGNLLFDAHLMIDRPLFYARNFADAGADHITFHVESSDDPAETIAEIHRLGLTAGMSLRPGTPVRSPAQYVHAPGKSCTHGGHSPARELPPFRCSRRSGSPQRCPGKWFHPAGSVPPAQGTAPHEGRGGPAGSAGSDRFRTGWESRDSHNRSAHPADMVIFPCCAT